MKLNITPLSKSDISNALEENRPFDISFLLKTLGFFSKDVKQKIQQQQFKINDEPLTMEHLKSKIVAYDEAGDFVFNNIESLRMYSYFNLEEMFIADIPKLQNLLSGLYILKIAKKKLYVIQFESI